MATGRADLGFTLAPTLLDAFRGAGAFAGLGPVPVRALAALNIQRTYFVTLEGLRRRSLDDVRGRVVSVGPPGSGSEDVGLRMLRTAGIDPDRDIQRQGLGLGAAADALKDGKLDAFFWMSGAGVPALRGPRHHQRPPDAPAWTSPRPRRRCNRPTERSCSAPRSISSR